MNLQELFIYAERKRERCLAGLALIRPREVARMKVRPQLDHDAMQFFVAFDARRDGILEADEAGAIRLALQCCTPFKNFWVLWGALGDQNSLDELETIQNDIIALRAVRKAVRWIEERQLIRKVTNDIARYA